MQTDLQEFGLPRADDPALSSGNDSLPWSCWRDELGQCCGGRGASFNGRQFFAARLFDSNDPQRERPDNVERRVSPGYGIGGPQRGTPFAAIVNQFISPLGIPCIKPPYGELAVVDLSTQEIVWRRGNGFWNLGFPALGGGTIVTKGGLIFFGSIQGKLRAIDVETGRQIWSDSLVRSSGATPMSYMSPNTGRQYVLVTVPLSSLDLTAEDLSEGLQIRENLPRREVGSLLTHCLIRSAGICQLRVVRKNLQELHKRSRVSRLIGGDRWLIN